MIWINGEIVHPQVITVEEPDPDMPDDVKEIYYEAARVLPASPRSAAVLVRLALQVLLKHISNPTGKLMNDIKNLVKEGYDADVINAMDLVRLLGDDGAHPDQIMLGQSVTDADELFFLLNYITKSKYDKLPKWRS